MPNKPAPLSDVSSIAAGDLIAAVRRSMQSSAPHAAPQSHFAAAAGPLPAAPEIELLIVSYWGYGPKDAVKDALASGRAATKPQRASVRARLRRLARRLTISILSFTRGRTGRAAGGS